MPPALTYALLVLCAAIFLGAFWVGARPDGSRLAPLRRWTLVAQIGAALAAYLVLRPGSGDDGQAAMERAAAEGRPVLLDFYSNY